MSRLLPNRGLLGPALVIGSTWAVAGVMLNRVGPFFSAESPAAAPDASDSAPIESPRFASAGSAQLLPILAAYQEARHAAREIAADDDPHADQGEQESLVAQDAEPAPASAPATAPASSAERRAEARRRAEEIRRRAEEEHRKSVATTQPASADDAEATTQPAASPMSPPPVETAPAPRTSPGDGGPHGEDGAPAATSPATPPSPEEPQPRGRRNRRPPVRARDDAATKSGDSAEEPAPGPVDTPAVVPPAVDDRTEWFTFGDMPWEDVVRHFVDRVGKPLIGEAPIIGGTLTYKAPRKMTRQEALDELNLLLHLQGYRFVELEHHVMLIPLSEMPQYVPIRNVYPTLEQFEGDGSLRDMDYVTVYMTVKDRRAEDVQEQFGDALGDYARFSVIENTNQLKITALVKDIRNFLALYRMVAQQPFDPRVMKVFPIKTNAAVMESMIKSLLNVPQGQQPRRVNPRTRQVEAAGSEEGIPTIFADDRTNTLIVKGTPAELRRVEEFLNELDKKQDIGEFKTEVMVVQYANARDIADLLNRIFQQEQGQTTLQQRVRQPVRRQPGQPVPVQPQPVPGQPLPQDIFVEDIYERARKTIRVDADERTNSLIVYANQDGLKRVRDMLSVIDRPVPSNFRTLALENADAETIQPIVQQIAQSVAPPTAGRAGVRGVSVVADASANALHVIADREAMSQIEEIVRQLDVSGAREERHVVILSNVKPSEMVPMVEALLRARGGAGSAATVRRPRGAGPTPAALVATPQVIAIDAADMLIVICPEEDWKKVEQVIRSVDERAVSTTEELRSFAITHGDAAAVAATLQQLFRVYNHPTLGRSVPAITPDRDAVYVYAVRPALDEIAALIPALDVEPDDSPLVILPLLHADATAVAQQVQPLLTTSGGAPRPRGAGGAPAAASVQADSVTNSLLIRADDATLERVTKFAREMDAKVASQTPERRLYALRFADARDVVSALTTLFTGAGGRGARGTGSAVKITQSGAQVLVEAPADKFPEIEKVVQQLDDPSGKQIVIKTIRMPGADVAAISTRLSSAFAAKAQRRGLLARFDPDPATESILLTCSEELLAEAEAQLGEFKDIALPLTPETQFRQLKHATAPETATWLSQQLAATLQGQSRSVAGQVRVTPDPRTNRVIVSGPSFAVKEAMKLLEEYDVPNEEMELVEKYVEVRNADAGYLAEQVRGQLRSKVAQTRGREIAERVNVTVDTRLNRLVLFVPRFALEMADSLIAELDQVGPDQAPVVFNLANADPAQVRELINAMYGQGRTTRQGAAQSTVQATVSNNTLVVRAPAKQLEEIRALISEIDSVDTGGVEVKVYPLKVLNAQQVAGQVNIFLAGSGQFTKGGSLKPAAFGEPVTNTLVVVAPRDKISYIDALVNRFESMAVPAGELRTHVLRNVRAEQIAPNIDQVLKAKVIEKEAGAKQKLTQTAVLAEATGNRVMVFAPPEYQDLAAEIIRTVDKEVEVGEVTHIIRLDQADAVQIAQSIMQTLLPTSGRGGRQVRVVADAGSNSLLVTGLPRDVQWVESTIAELDASSSASIPELQVFQLSYANALDVADAMKAIFPPAARPMDMVTVTADDFYNRLIVTASKRRMRGVEDYIRLLDAAPDTAAGGLPGGKQLYFVDIFRGDAFDIAYDVEDMLPPRSKGGPDLSPDWDGKYIKVICRPDEIENVTRLIREFDDRAKPSLKVTVIKPRDLARFREYLKMNMPDLPIDDLAPPAEKPSIIMELPPPTRAPADGDTRSQRRDEKPPAARPAAPPPPRRSSWSPPISDAQIAAFVRGKARPEALGAPRAAVPVTRVRFQDVAPRAAASRPATPPAGETRRREPPKLQPLPDGQFLVHGNKAAVEEILDILDLIESDLGEGEVIRIFEFKHGDVTAAAAILDKMFNESPAARMAAQQQLQQQMQAMQQQQQQQQQQRGGRDGQDGGRGGGQGQAGAGGAGLLDAMRGLLGGGGRGATGAPGGRGGGTSIRIATDAGHNRLIIKCQESMLPDIIQLLRELDIPPSDVDVRVFQLRSLDAEETARNIKEVLGIERARQARPTPGLPAAVRGQPNQEQLLQILQQQMAVALPGGDEAARIESVEIVANRVTNSLMVSAPPDVMDIIDDVITRLEQLEGRDVLVIEHRTLRKAKVDDVLPLLQEVFSSAGERRGAGPGAARGSPADVGPVSISGDPRTNTLIIAAQKKDIAVVDEQIGLLDVEGPVADAEIHVCKYGEAEDIARAVSEIYAVPAGRGAPGEGPRRGSAGGAGQEVRITAEPATNTIIVFAPTEKRGEILGKIRELDALNPKDVREITVFNADPEKLAEQLRGIFGGRAAGAAGAAGRGPRGAGGVGERVVVVGVRGDTFGKLVVRAPDEVVKQIEKLVDVLDVPSKQLQIKHFPLTYADAEVVVESVRGALFEFMTVMRQTGGTFDFDAFTAVADPRTNSIVAVGSPETFAFVQNVLDAIDVKTPEERRKTLRVFALVDGDAQAVADAINHMAGAGAAGARRADGRGAGGRAPGGIGPGASFSSASDFNVVASADPVSNTLMVFGRPEDIALVDASVIRPMVGSMARRVVEVEVANVPPSQVATQVLQFWSDTAAAGASAPQIQPVDAAGTLVVFGTDAQIEKVRQLAAQFDKAGQQFDPIKVIPVPVGQDVVALARTVEDVVSQGERAIAEARGTKPRAIRIGADPYSNTLIVYGEPSTYAMVENIVRQLDDVRGGSQMVTRVIRLGNLSADDARAIIEDLQRSRGGGATPTRAAPGGGARPAQPATPPGGGFQPQPRRTSGSAQPSAPPAPRRGGTNPGAQPAAQPERPRRDSGDRPVGDAPRRAPRGGSGGELVLAAGGLGAQGTVLFMQHVALEDAPAASAPAVEVREGLSGELRGPVIATPLDSHQIIITGDARDVDFLQQMLALMEGSAPRPQIRVFALQHAKAAALAQPLTQTVDQLIAGRTERRTRGDLFSIIAEARGNALIVAASESNMEMIASIIERLDVSGVGTDVTTVPLYYMQAGEAARILGPIIDRLNTLRGNPAEAQASVEAIDRANALLVMGTNPDIEEIIRLIESIDIELTDEQRERGSFNIADVMVINLRNAVAEDLAAVLEELIAGERAAGGAAAAPGGRASSASLIRQLRLTTPEGRQLPPLDLDRPIVIKPEKGTNSLIVFSSPRNNESLREIVGLFDSLPHGEDVEVKAILLRHAAAQTVAETLRTLLDDAKASLKRPAEGTSGDFDRGVMPPVPGNLAGRGLPYAVTLGFDARSNTVVVIGRKDAVALAAGLITQLDRPSGELNLKPYVLTLKNKPATELKDQLTELLKQREEAIGAKDKNTARDGAVLMADDRSNSLLILATPEVYELVKGMIAPLDEASSYRTVSTRFRRLEYADAAKLQGLLQDMFDKKKTTESDITSSKDKVDVLADARSNSLLLVGTRDYLDEAESLIARLDQRYEPTIEFKVRPVVLNSAASIATLLTEMIDKTRGEQDAKMRGTPVHISADAYSNNLLIGAAREDMVMVERWIELLDRPVEPGRVFEIVPVRRQRAEDLAQQVDAIFQRSGGAGTGAAGNDVTVTFDAATNSVVAVGPPAIVRDIRAMIRQLDEVEPDGALVRHFKLEQAAARDAGDLLRSILGQRPGSVGGGGTTGTGAAADQESVKQAMLIFQKLRPGGGIEVLKAMRNSIVVIDDLRTNSLHVTAPAESMPLVESLVAAIDVPPDAAQIKVFPLRNSTADEMVRTLQDIFQRRTSTGAGGAAAPQDGQERVLTLGEGGAGGREEVTFTSDVRTNAVIAAGTKGYLAQVEQLIYQLDTIPIEARKVLVYEPHNNQAAAIQAAVQSYNDGEKQMLDQFQEEVSASERMRREILAVTDPNINRVIFSYDPRRERDVFDLVRELDQPPPQVMIQVLIVEVTLDNSLELGVEFAFQDLQFMKAGPTDTTTFDFVGGTDIGAAGSGLGGFSFTITGADFNFLLRALQSEGTLNVLSRPQIVAMDNQLAKIDISNDVPYVTGTSTSVAGQVTTQVNRQKVGIIMEVTPQINPDGYVRMQIRQEVSDITDSTVQIAPGVNSPVFFTRIAETNVMVRDNETVVLGGLITSRESRTEQKVPFVGDIPFIGPLFRFSSVEDRRTELLLVLTPRVIRTVEDFREVSARERDRVDTFPPEVLTSPLLNDLRVAPEDLPFKSSAYPPVPPPQAQPPEEQDEYGPMPGSNNGGRDRPEPQPDTYDVPLTRLR